MLVCSKYILPNKNKRLPRLCSIPKLRASGRSTVLMMRKLSFKINSHWYMKK